MPKQKANQDFDKDVALAAYLRIPRVSAQAARVDAAAPKPSRFPIYFYANRFYLVFRNDQRPYLVGHAFELLASSPRSPWAIFAVSRHPPRMYNTDHLRDGGALERVRRGEDVNNLSLVDCQGALGEAVRQLHAAEIKLAKFENAPREDFREAARVAAELQVAKEEIERLKQMTQGNESDRALAAEARCQELQDNLEAAERGHTESLVKLQEERDELFTLLQRAKETYAPHLTPNQLATAGSRAKAGVENGVNYPAEVQRLMNRNADLADNWTAERQRGNRLQALLEAARAQLHATSAAPPDMETADELWD